MKQLTYDLMETCDNSLDSINDEDYFKSIYPISNLKKFSYYIDADINEVTIVLCDDESTLEQAVTAFNDHIKSQIHLYDLNDKIEKVNKLENAIIKTKGLYAILCVCDDYSKANNILKEYGVN